jgi:hypothetical protein
MSLGSLTRSDDADCDSGRDNVAETSVNLVEVGQCQ